MSKNIEDKSVPAMPFSDIPVRYLNKDINPHERHNYTKWWEEQINHYGVEVNYYVNNHSLTGQDFISGEHPTQLFTEPVKVIVVLNLNENAISLSQFGIMSDDEVTAIISIPSYVKNFGEGAEPKAGDIFELEEYGRTRPGGRTGKIFEITQRVDQDVSQINQLQGHYVWLMTAKRFDYSYEPGAPVEGPLGQVNDDLLEGRLPGGINEPIIIKSYTGDVDDISVPVYDYRVFLDQDHVYGDY